MKNSEALAQIFAMNDWTPSIWARKSGFSLNQIIRWQKGLTKNIRPNNLVRLAWIILYKVDWLDPMQTECEIYPFLEEEFGQKKIPREFIG